MGIRLGMNPFNGLPRVTRLLIVFVIAGYLAQLAAGEEAVQLFGLVPLRVVKDKWLWQPVTYMFLHGGFLHLAINALMLWIFGPVLERSWGSKEFFKYFFLTGIGAAVVATAVNPWSARPIIGASGAIYGLMVAFALMNPGATVLMYFLFPVTALQMVLFLAAVEFLAGIFSSNSLVANFAHLGGMATGYLYLSIWPCLKIRFAQGLKTGSRHGNEDAGVYRAEIEANRILDKISEEGMDSLSPEERSAIKKYSEKLKE